MTDEKCDPPPALDPWWLPKNPSTSHWNSSPLSRVQSPGTGSRSRVDHDQQLAVGQDAVAGYRVIKLVAAMPISNVYAIDTIVAEMVILSIFGSLTRERHAIHSRAPQCSGVTGVTPAA